MRISDFSSARVAIWGMGGEGISAIHALRSRLPEKKLTVLEEAVHPTLPEWVLADEKIQVKLGCVTPALLKKFDVIIRSPGISIYRDEIIEAKQAGVRFTSGTNIWFSENTQCNTICVTGSKGKSTTTHLIGHLLNSFEVSAIEAGNIGIPLLDSLAQRQKAALYVVELSSYQLSDFTGIPTIAVLLNLYPEHLDWHKGEEAYFKDKINLLARVARSRIINRQDQRSRKYVESLENVVYFNSEEGFHHDALTVYWQREPWFTLKDVQLLGAHNLSNICAALTAVARYGISLKKEIVLNALRRFKGLNHRLTRIGERKGVLYVNDSIATIPQAAVAALKTFAGRAITLLVGGYDRGLDQHEFAEMILHESPFAVVTLPDTGHTLYKNLRALLSCAADKKIPIVYAAVDLDHAVAIAQEITPSGGVVLLSPGAPSFNSHRNFAERGEAFAKAAGFPLQALA